MARRYGRAPRGERCRLAVPHGHYKTTTITAALRSDGLFATTPFDGATNGARFQAYVTDTLLPVLRSDGVTYYEVPAEYDASGYRYTIVNDRPVLVEPGSRRIVEVIWPAPIRWPMNEVSAPSVA